MATKEQIHQEVRGLALQIYVKLAAKACVLTEQSVKMSTSAENLARVSFKLASAFQAVETQLAVESAPTSATLDAATVASWNK